MGYLTFPFILLEFRVSARGSHAIVHFCDYFMLICLSQASLQLYLNLYMCLHIVGLLVIYGLPQFMRGERSQPQKASNAPVLGSSTTSMNGTANNAKPTHPILITKETDDAQSNKIDGLTVSNGHLPKIVPTTTVQDPNNAHKIEQFVDTIPIDRRNQCDINVNNTELRLKTDNGISDGGDVIGGDGDSNASTAIATAPSPATNNNYNNDSDQHLSLKIRERIDSETRLIEDKLVSSFDKTVTGIVELKDDLMRVNDDEMYGAAGMKMINDDDATGGGLRKRNLADITNGKEIETFLRKEMNNANVKVVLGNSQAD